VQFKVTRIKVLVFGLRFKRGFKTIYISCIQETSFKDVIPFISPHIVRAMMIRTVYVSYKFWVTLTALLLRWLVSSIYL